MRVGVPTEIKTDERRVGLIPASVHELVEHGHEVLVQSGAGDGIHAPDEEYEAAGGRIVPTAEAIYEQAELVVKVKEPQPRERAMLREGQLLFTYLHLAPDPDQTADLVASGATCIAYETVTNDEGRLPLLSPMSQVAGRLSIQAGAHALEAASGGAGVLLGGVPGVPGAKVTVIGGGVVGLNAIEMALGLGADVTVLDRDLGVLERLAARFGPGVAHRLLHRRQPQRRGRSARRPGDRGGAGARGARPEPRDRGARPPDAARHGARRRRHRPGRVLRDLAPDHPHRPDLPRARRRPLLRGEHARGGADDVQPRAEQRDAAARDRARRPRASTRCGATRTCATG